jgi:hypothetical protein
VQFCRFTASYYAHTILRELAYACVCHECSFHACQTTLLMWLAGVNLPVVIPPVNTKVGKRWELIPEQEMECQLAAKRQRKPSAKAKDNPVPGVRWAQVQEPKNKGPVANKSCSTTKSHVNMLETYAKEELGITTPFVQRTKEEMQERLPTFARKMQTQKGQHYCKDVIHQIPSSLTRAHREYRQHVYDTTRVMLPEIRLTDTHTLEFKEFHDAISAEMQQ